MRAFRSVYGLDHVLTRLACGSTSPGACSMLAQSAPQLEGMAFFPAYRGTLHLERFPMHSFWIVLQRRVQSLFNGYAGEWVHGHMYRRNQLFFLSFFLRPASFSSAGGFSSASWALLARFPAPAIGGHSAAAVEGLESCKFKRWRKVESIFGKVNRKRKAAPGLPSRTPAWCWAAISNRRQIAC